MAEAKTAAKKSEERSDLQLIREFRRGKQESFEELVGRYSNKAFSLAFRLTRSPEDAEEVLQDVFTTVHRKIAGFEGKSSFSSWLYRVTVNAALMKLRKRRRDPTTSIEDLLPNTQELMLQRHNDHADVDEIALRNELKEALELAIQRLPDEYRPVFVLRDVDGLTNREVSKILNISVPAVKSRLHRSRLMLRRRLKQIYSEVQLPKGEGEPRVANS